MADSGPNLDHWLTLASAGYHLSPVRLRRDKATGRKRVRYLERWSEAATTDPRRITEWYDRYGRREPVSFLIACKPSGIVVVDLDLKPADQVDAVGWWARQGLPCGSLIVDTPSGGQHHYFRQRKAAPIANSTGAIAPGVDIRGEGGEFGGLVYAPGSLIIAADGDGGDLYRLLDQLQHATELDEIPDAIVERIPERRRHRKDTPKPGSGAGGRAAHDADWVIAQVEELATKVRKHEPRPGTGFRYALMGAAMMAGRAVAAGLRTREYAEEHLREAVCDVWGAPDADDIAWIDVGLDDGEADPFTIEPKRVKAEDGESVPADLDEDPDAHDAYWQLAYTRERVRREVRRALDAAERPYVPAPDELVVWNEGLADVPLPAMAIPTIVPENGVGWLGGPSGSYKSFVAVSLTGALAFNRPALGDPQFLPRRPRRVLYVAGEDHTGVALRLRAWQHLNNAHEPRRVALYPRPVDLTVPSEVDRIANFAVANGIEFVVIDTFRQSTLGVNENDNTEVGLVLGRFIALRDAHGIGSLLVDHTNKTAQGLADLGGAGAKRANADYVLMIDLPNGDRSVGQQRMLRNAKQKGRPDGQTWPIRLEAVDDVTDAEGQASAVVLVGQVDRATAPDIHGTEEWRNVAIPEDVREFRGDGRTDLPRVAQLVIFYGSGESGVSRAEVTDYFRAAVPGVTKDAARKRVNRAWDALHALGRLEPVSQHGTSRISHHRWSTNPVPLAP